MLSAAVQRATAARERIESAGRLPDPEVEGMTSRMNGPMGERSTMYELNVRQPLPKRGERAANRDRARASAARSGISSAAGTIEIGTVISASSGGLASALRRVTGAT